MSEPVEFERVACAGSTFAHFRKAGSRRGSLCKQPVVGPVPASNMTMCAACLRLAGKLLTPKQTSPLELEAERLIAAAGLPAPEKQYLFAEAVGRRWRFDFAWPGHRVALEVDGDLWHGRHTSGDGRQADMVRDAYAAIMGWLVFRCDRDLLRQGFAMLWIARSLMRPSTPWNEIPMPSPGLFPDERTLAPKRWERKRQKAAARRAEARA